MALPVPSNVQSSSTSTSSAQSDGSNVGPVINLGSNDGNVKALLLSLALFAAGYYLGSRRR